MTNHPTSPADGPTQAQLDQLSAKLEEKYNSSKAWICELRLREWDEKYAPYVAFRSFKNVWGGWGKLEGGFLLFILALLPLVLAIMLLAPVYFGIEGCWNYRKRLKLLSSSPPRPNEADLAYNIRIPLSAGSVRSYRDVARVVCANLAPHASYFSFMNAEGVSVGSKFGVEGKLSYVEYEVLEACLRNCRALVDKDTVEAYRSHHRQTFEEACRRRKECGPGRINEGDEDINERFKEPSPCRRCGETSFMVEDGWMRCSLCYSQAGRAPRDISPQAQTYDVTSRRSHQRRPAPPLCKTCGGELAPLAISLPGLNFCERCYHSAKGSPR
jgi:ribosomal protein L37E